MAFLAVFVALKIAHRAGGYAVWSWIPTICDLRRSDYHLVQLKKSVTTDFRGQQVAESGSRVRHDAGVFRPNGWHQRNANGEKPPKPGSFGIWGPPTKKVEAKKLNQEPEPAKCALRPVQGTWGSEPLKPIWPSGNKEPGSRTPVRQPWVSLLRTETALSLPAQFLVAR